MQFTNVAYSAYESRHVSKRTRERGEKLKCMEREGMREYMF